MKNDNEASLARVAEKVRALSGTCPFGFWFVTDLHVPSNACRSGGMLARLVGETGLRTVVSGGDIPEAFGPEAELDASFAKYRETWVEPVERAGGAFFAVHGNHDMTIRTAPGAQTGATWPADKTRAALSGTAAMRSRAVADPSSCAFYADFPEAGVRLVALDTHDSVDPDRPFWGVESGVSEPQLRWLSRTALGTLPDGWRVVAASHAPFAGVAAEEDERALYAGVRDAFAPLAAAGRVPLAVSGHHHGERQSKTGGVWHVTEPCDAAYLDYIHSSLPWVPDLPVKEPGAWSGQTFDAVQFDFARGRVHFTRVGGGADRTLRLSPVRLRAGETVRIEPEILSGPLVWGCYDADRADKRPNPERKYDYFYDYHFDVAGIDPDGTLRALRPGEAAVVARAADGAREYVPVEVLPR